MRSLFVRIFVWFWVTLILVGAVLVVFSPLMTRTRPRLALWEDHAEEWGLRRVERVAEEIKRGGVPGLRFDGGRERKGRGGPHQMRLLVFDSLGDEVTGRRSDPEARDLALQAMDQSQAVARRSGSRHLTAQPVTDSRGRSLAVVGILERPPRLVDLLEPKRLMPSLGALAIVGGLLVLWLAHHLSAPVSALRSATRELASGDLAARVNEKVAHRRDEFGELARDFDAMAERVQSLVESQRRLLQDVSHELRSPLARLNVALELARRGSPDGEERALGRIEKESDQLNALIGRLLELTRMEGGTLPTEKVNLSQVVSEVVADARFEAEGAKVRIETGVGPASFVLADPALLRSAVENVVRNGIRYTAEETEVAVDLELQGQEVVVRVSDRGPGVPSGDLQKIFEPFHRVQTARDRQSGGTGLGLAIASRAIKQFGGRIHAENRGGGGLTVEIRLPVDQELDFVERASG
ncbi:MAG: HAMP domain-containing protein [Thermoanaerobaculales bacterium]|nr:HAMP domain-containing protein [Thermoanaerobaculales bacterium]